MNEYFPDNILEIPHHIPGKVSQYMTINGVKNYNLCGHFCVAYIMQDEAGTSDIDKFLEYWEVQTPKLWKSLFNKYLGRTTSTYDLTQMILAYENVETFPFSSVPRQPEILQNLLKTHQAIIGVQIDSRGYPVGKGISHWIVLEDLMVVDDVYSIATIYNPFNNSLRPISWQELMISTGAYKQGLWVKR